MSKLNDQLATSIKGAELEDLKTGALEETEEDSFADVLVDIKDGRTTPEEVDERVADLLNDLIDIPYVPEYVEGKVIGFSLNGVKAALVQVVERLEK